MIDERKQKRSDISDDRLFYFGMYHLSLAKDMRLNIPRRFVENGLQDCAIIVPDGNHLRIYEKTSFEDLLHGISKPVSNADHAVFRFVISNAVECKIDPRFRIKIPRELAEKSNIKPGNPVVLVGVKNCAELYDAETWKSFNANS